MFSKIRRLMMTPFTVCPRTGKITGIDKVKRKSLWLWIIIGMASVIWVLIRVVPKPSRAEYPCQKVARPIAASFIIWLLGLIGSSLIMRKAKRLFQRKRYMLGVFCFTMAIMVCFFSFSDTRDVAASAAAPFVPTDPANSPMGTATGINPGRVVWVYDSELTDKTISSGYWWQTAHTDTAVARQMMAQAICNLTGIFDQAEAWDTIFRYFNQKRYGENVGYKAGDKITIKLNNINSRFYDWGGSENVPCPQMVHALIWHLVNKAGVPEEDITFYDCIFYIGAPVYDLCHADFPGVRWAEGDATDRVDGHGYEFGPGENPGTREKVVRDSTCVIHYSDTNIVKGSGKVCLPTIVSEARYLMSMCLPREHTDLAGVTLCAKNYFGSVWHPWDYQYYHHWQPQCMHAAVAAHPLGDIPQRPMGSYNALVDIMGHKELGGKTMLCLGDLTRKSWWPDAPFNSGPASSLFISQDFVAFESVLLDFLRYTGRVKSGTVDNYLHEASQAGSPPSGTVYDPENDGAPLQSLGVHEHWNNSTDKQYTRNLGTGDGIELIKVIDNVTNLDTTHTDTGSTTPVIDRNNMTSQDNFTLFANTPNPFTISTTICYSLKVSADIRLNIYNMKGERVRTLINKYQSAGNFEINWNGCNDDNMRLASGIYVYRMEINTGGKRFSQSRQMLLR
ncbi:MAG: DUF362 domain-containing protein [Bacteroidales bacterium]|nr:DUF362 domain-containing protein [Bacteroidales bacterium]